MKSLFEFDIVESNVCVKLVPTFASQVGQFILKNRSDNPAVLALAHKWTSCGLPEVAPDEGGAFHVALMVDGKPLTGEMVVVSRMDPDMANALAFAILGPFCHNKAIRAFGFVLRKHADDLRGHEWQEVA